MVKTKIEILENGSVKYSEDTGSLCVICQRVFDTDALRLEHAIPIDIHDDKGAAFHMDDMASRGATICVFCLVNAYGVEDCPDSPYFNNFDKLCEKYDMTSKGNIWDDWAEARAWHEKEEG